MLPLFVTFEKTLKEFLQAVLQGRWVYKTLDTFSLFWTHYPACYFGLWLVLGCCVGFSLSPALWIPLALSLLLTLYKWPRCVAGILIALGMFVYVHRHYSFPSLPEEGVTGSALFSIEEVAEYRSPFSKMWKCSGTLRVFISSSLQEHVRNAPCALFLPHSPSPPSGGLYHLSGLLKRRTTGFYNLKAIQDGSWETAGGNLARERYQWKKVVGSYFERHMPHRKSAEFLTGIMTGSLSSFATAFDLQQVGLQHIMAVSGMHFVLFASVAKALFRCLFRPQIASFFLLCALALFIVYIGFRPSIFRAWIMVSLLYFAQLSQHRRNALNALGFALIASVLFNPLWILEFGFVFSFTITGAILLFTPWIHRALAPFFSTHLLRDVLPMNTTQQLGVILSALFRQALALGFAVHLVVIPLSLLFFHSFNASSLLYNLCFPFLITFSMALGLIGSLWHLLALPGGAWIHHINSDYLSLLLKLCSPPPSLRGTFTFSPSLLSITLFFCLLFFLGILGYQKKHEFRFVL